MKADVIVVGGGAAGIMASYRAASVGASVLLLEKTDRIGTKILISGGGKCNITHDGPLEEVLRAFRQEEARFIRPACYRFQPTQIVELLNNRGVQTYTRPDGRIFPVEKTAKDVVRALVGLLEEAGVEMRTRCAVGEILHEGHGVSGVRTRDGEVIDCRRIVLTTGGCTYSNCGTSGDGWPWTEALGHSLVPIRAALAPMYLAFPWEAPSGVALRNVTLKARERGKEVARWTGDLLFTHQGVSGPCALGISREVAERMESGAVNLEVDFHTELSFEALTDSIRSWVVANPRKRMVGYLERAMPDSIAARVLADAGLDPQVMASSVDKRSRNRLIETLKAWKLGSVTHVPLEKGEVAAGGVSLAEVDPQTMRSKVCEGLYLAGEILDIAGPVGGYNLQAAWATGYVAGESAAKDVGKL